jgi:hypothetical protein
LGFFLGVNIGGWNFDNSKLWIQGGEIRRSDSYSPKNGIIIIKKWGK